MSEAIKPKCCGLVSPAGSWREYPCGKNASMEHEGNHYCKTHHPPTIRARQDARTAQLIAEMEEQNSRSKARHAEAAEQKRRADCYAQLVERVKELEDTLHSLHKRFSDCALAGTSAAEAYDSFYQFGVADVLSKSLPNTVAEVK